jgi:hypothetical protein
MCRAILVACSMSEAAPEVRADPRSRDAYVLEIEDPDRPSWDPPSNPDEYALR